MKNFKNYLEEVINECMNEIRFLETEGRETSKEEAAVEKLKKKVDILNDIEAGNEGNLLKFNEDGSFHLWCIRCPEDGKLIIEEYQDAMTFENFEDMLQETKCFDVTNSVSMREIANAIISATEEDGLYAFVNNDTLYDMLP